MTEKKEGTITISKNNIGYKLLEKAGWNGHGGIGAQQQGRIEPLLPDIRPGNIGLGFETKKKKHPLSIKDSREKDREGGGGAAGGSGVNTKSPSSRKLSTLPRDELEDEDIDKKVKRVKQVLQAEADEKAGKELAKLVYSAFRDDGGGGSGSTTDVNPLLRKNRKLSAQNPLL
jgi:hypothetical protein